MMLVYGCFSVLYASMPFFYGRCIYLGWLLQFYDLCYIIFQFLLIIFKLDKQPMAFIFSYFKGFLLQMQCISGKDRIRYFQFFK